MWRHHFPMGFCRFRQGLNVSAIFDVVLLVVDTLVAPFSRATS